MIDPLFGKYCYIDTPWIAGEKTVYRIIRSGVRSNSWCEVPVNGRTKKVNHGEHSEEIVFVMLDTLIDEDTKIMRFALKDVEIIEMADRKVSEKPTSSENPNNCETCKHDLWHTPRMCGKCVRQEDGKPSMYEPKTEPQTWTKENCKGCKYNEYPYDSGTCFVRVCINGNKYEPKTEPLDKDTNVRSKAVYDKWGNVFDARADIEDEPQCKECGHWEHGAGDHYYCALLEMGQECYFESKDESTLMFANEPKTEPQVIVCPIQEEDASYARWLYEDEPQTERSE